MLCLHIFLTSSCMYLIRGNTSVDESYEWDSSDDHVDSDVLEAMRFDQLRSQRGRVELLGDQTAGLQDQQQKGEHADVMFMLLHMSS